MVEYAIAIDIGGTKISAALVGDDGSIVGTTRARADTPHTGGDDVARTVVAVAHEVRHRADEAGVEIRAGIGIGSAGVIDAEGRGIASATDAIPGWSGTPLADIVEDALGLPVIIENDVHAHARGESLFGAGAGSSSALVIAVGTGIGGAFVLDGQVVRGSRGLCGHVGHVPVAQARGRTCSCGCDAHLEAIGAGPGMVRWYNDLIADSRDTGVALTPVVNAVELEQRANAGDEVACRVFHDGARATGEATAGLVNSLDPEVVIFGGGLSHAGAVYWEALRAGYADQLMPALSDVPIIPAQLGNSAALAGAGALAFANHRTRRR